MHFQEKTKQNKKTQPHLSTLFLYIVHNESGVLGFFRSQNKSMRFHKKAVMKAMYSQMHTTLNHKHVHLKLKGND